MGWQPSYVVEGLFRPLLPTVTFNGLIDLCSRFGNLYDISHGIAGGYSQSYWDEGGAKPWVSAAGADFNKVIIPEFKSKAWTGGVTHSGVDLIEIFIDNPEGAQFYKQSLVVIGGYQCTNYAESTAEDQGETFVLDYTDCEVGLVRIVRREYPTPYSSYTQETLFEGTVATNFFLAIFGSSDIWVESLYWFLKRGLFCMGTATHNNKEYFCFGFYTQKNRQTAHADPVRDEYAGNFVGLEKDFLDEKFGAFMPEEQDDPNDDPDEPPGPGDDDDGGGGGNGNHELPDMPIPLPDLPDVSPAEVSWLTVYKMTGPQLSEFGEEMVDPDLWSAITQFFNNPLDAIVNIILCPIDAPTTRTKTPQVGRGPLAKQWTNAYPVVSNQYVSVNCGSIQFLPYWDSAFDFDPYTKISIFLPFIGYKPLKVDEVMGCGVNVTYHFDVCTGDCIAFISRIPFEDDAYGPYQPQLIAQFQGNCGVRVPIGRLSSDAAIDASMRLMTQGMGLVGDLAGSAAGGKNGLSDPSNLSMSQVGDQLASATMTAVNGMKAHIERSGALGGNSGYMGKLRPYIVREIPRQVLSKPNKDHYWKLEGYPANIGANLGYVAGSGLQMVEAIELDGLPAYDSEITEIESILKGGVIV